MYSKLMPLGKHQGKQLQEIPSAYLRWALSSLQYLDHDLRWAIHGELYSREPAPRPPHDQAEQLRLAQEVAR